MWCCRHHHYRWLSRCFQQRWIGRIECTSVSVEREVPIVKVFAKCVRLCFSNSQVLWAQFRHPLAHRSRESCHCRVHRSVRGLLTNFFHPSIELLELKSQQLDFLSGCHHHSTPQVQDNGLRYHARVGNDTKTCSSALCTMDDTSYFLVIRLGPKTSECEKSVIVMSTVPGCEVSNGATSLNGFKKQVWNDLTLLENPIGSMFRTTAHGFSDLVL